MKNNKKQISHSQAVKIMKEFCERMGIPFTSEQRPEGTTIVGFMPKLKEEKKKD